MNKSTIIDINNDTKNILKHIIAIASIVLGVIIIYDYLLAFFRLLLGLALIIIGLLYYQYIKNPYNRLFFRF